MQKNIYKKITPGKIFSKENNTNIALLGDLGTGKTHFVREFVKLYAPKLETLVTSPTFSYQQIYQSEKLTIHHFDLYRIENEQKLLDIGLWDSLEDKKVITFIEWADMFSLILEFCDFCFYFFLENMHYKIKDGLS